MKIISWNVNGIRAAIKKGFYDFVKESNPDIICLQETKANKEQVELNLPDYQYQYWNSAEKKGYSGTAIFSKNKPMNITNGIGLDHHDNEGRVITLEFETYFLVTVYTPNAKRELLRLEYRMEWDKDFLNYVKELDKNKPVVFCGDLNVAHTELDLRRPKTNHHNPGFTDEERRGFTNIVEAGFIDTFREFTKEGGHYTWWSYMFQARVKDIGWRIDYFCISERIKNKLKESVILKDVMGSDHCPVMIEIEK